MWIGQQGPLPGNLGRCLEGVAFELASSARQSVGTMVFSERTFQNLRQRVDVRVFGTQASVNGLQGEWRGLGKLYLEENGCRPRDVGSQRDL